VEKKIETERGNVFYWIKEENKSNSPCIVYCHGVTADHRLFDLQMEHISNIKMISWDMPLHGKSRPYSSFSYQNTVEDLKQILQAESIDKVVLVGQSAGGYIAQAYIRKYPEDVSGFVGVGTTPFGAQYYKKSDLFWIKHFARIAKWYPYSYYCKAGSKGVTYTEDARALMYETLSKLGKEGMLLATDSIYSEFLKQIESVDFQCPLILSYGEFDKKGLVKKYNTQWGMNLGVEPIIIKGAAHNANYDNYKDFNNMLLEFTMQTKK
jgi:pimeloyl-ACP methyl ester carboxylesterase